jgi:hypothetical protein
MARRCRRTPCRTGRVCRLARQAAGGDPRLGNLRSAASHCRSRSRRTERHRTAARLWPRLSLPMTAPRQSLHLLRWRLTRQPARDITTNDPLGDPPRPPSNRNGGRFQIGIPGRLRRNPHTCCRGAAQLRDRIVPRGRCVRAAMDSRSPAGLAGLSGCRGGQPDEGIIARGEHVGFCLVHQGSSLATLGQI